MSRKYQGLVVLSTKALEGSVEELVSSITKTLETEGAKVEKVAELGRREFAYSPRNIASGHYVNFIFQGTPESISKIQGRLSLNENVYLNQFQRIA
ncbi:MAG: 30S ribosomal protein S6 [Luteolibacter sp.]